MNATTYGLDVAKRVFQMYWVDAQTGEIVNRRFGRDELLGFLAQRRAGRVALEACGKLPDFCISTMTKTPAQPPIQDAAITHHAEIIQLPRFFAVRLPEVSPAAPLGSVCATANSSSVG